MADQAQSLKNFATVNKFSGNKNYVIPQENDILKALFISYHNSLLNKHALSTNHGPGERSH